MTDAGMEPQMRALIASIEAESARVRDEGLRDLLGSLNDVSKGLADALGLLIVAESEGRELTDEIRADARSVLLAWKTMHAGVNDVLETLKTIDAARA